MRWAMVMALGVGCGMAPGPTAEGFSTQPFQSIPSRGHQYLVAIRTSPQPPARGALSVQYTIASSVDGTPASGLVLSVVPWMPAMDHGTSVVPSVVEASPGTYMVANVDLFMAGWWVLRTTISGAAPAAGDAGTVGDYVEPSFEIP
jgi:YtkA-like protein